MNNIDAIKEILANRGYTYKKTIGKGGFSTVFLCESTKYKTDFAIKRSRHHRLTDFEYSHLVSLDHPNIIKLYDAFDDPSSQYLVMEHCSCSLFEKGKLSYEKFVNYSKKILMAVAFCHEKKIAHRDIKPDNIFIDKYDNIKLADFGMAKKFNFFYEMSDEKCGSLMCLPPEMLDSDEINPFKADIWSLGITFFFMATGCFPFQSKNIEEIKKMIRERKIDFMKYKINPNIILLINKMTEKNVVDRPSAEKLLDLPIFNTVEKKKVTSSKGYRTKLSTKENKNILDKNHFHCHINEILSYRKINVNPKIDKINHRFVHNTF